MVEECYNFVSWGEWKLVRRSNVQKQERKPTLVKWVFKINQEQDVTSQYKTRIVFRGFLQIPGVNFTGSFSPVACKTSIHVLIGTALYYKWEVKMFDVEAAFLNAQCENKTFVEWPEAAAKIGLASDKTMREYCIMLEKAMYSTVDAALLWMKDFTKYLKSISMKQSHSNPCVFYKQDNGKLTLILAVYVDNTLLAGTEEEKHWIYQNVTEKYSIFKLGRLCKHLGIWYNWKTDNNGKTYVKMTMPKLVDNTVAKYQELAKEDVKQASTPGTPGQILGKMG